MPCKAQPMTGPCWALPEGLTPIISSGNNLFRQWVSLEAMPCKARSMTGPCWALLQGMISSSKALQGPVNDWALPGFAGRSETNDLWAKCQGLPWHELPRFAKISKTVIGIWTNLGCKFLSRWKLHGNYNNIQPFKNNKRNLSKTGWTRNIEIWMVIPN